MDKLKKFFCAVLVSVLVLSGGPFVELKSFANALSSSGSCGNNVSYSYNSSTQALTISGSGAMYDYDGDTSPFYQSDIKSVTVTGSVTHIGEWAFDDCDNLTEIKIGDSVTSIGAYAFADCSAVTTVNIPKNVNEIGVGAFANENSLQSITVDVNNFYFSSDDSGALYNNNKTVLYQFPIGSSRLTYTLHPSTLTVESYAFWNSNLKEIILNKELIRIKEYAFKYSDYIDYVYYPGTSAEWGQVRVASNNSGFTDATLRYCRNITSGSSQTVSLSAGEYDYFVFTPTRTATYTVAASGSYDNVGVIYYAGEQLARNDDYNGSYNFSISQTMNARESYIIETRMYSSSTSGSFSIGITPDTYDTTAPYLSLSCTNNVATTQTMTYTFYDDVEVDGYYWGTSKNYTDNRYIQVPAEKIVSFERQIYNPGTYYIAVKDTSGNVSQEYAIPFYKTTFNANGGSVSPSYVITRGGKSFTLPTAKKSGVVFYGWSVWTTSERGVTGSYKPTSNTVQNAVWHAHTYNSKVTKAATCTATGVKTYTCSSCNESYTETIPAKGHKWNAATCQKPKTCSVCGATTGSKLSHNYTYKVTKAATMSANGTKTGTCSYCKGTKTVTIYKISSVALSATSYAYNGNSKTPSVTVKDSKGNTLKKGTDYTVSYSSGRTNIGTYNVKVTFKGNYSGSKTLTFKIIPGKVTNLKNSGRTLSWSKVAGAESYQVYMYNNSTQKWEKSATTSKTSYTVPQKYGCGNLKARVRAVKGEYYGALAELSFKTSHSYTYKLTKAATMSANGTKTGTCAYCKGTKKVTIYKISSVTLSAKSYAYDGKVKTPAVTVKDSNGNTLKKDTDYTVSYSSGRKALGKYNVKVTFKGNYSGSKTLEFSIVLGKVKNFTPEYDYKNYPLALHWDKVAGATKYEIQKYNTKTGWITVIDAPANATTAMVPKKLCNGTCKWRVRAVRESGGKTYYGAWSATVTTNV